jgi:hypothetical protein
MPPEGPDPSRVFLALCVGWLIITGLVCAAIAPWEMAWAFLVVTSPLFFFAATWALVVPIAAVVVAVRRMIKRRYLQGLAWSGFPVLAVAIAMLGSRAGDAIYFVWHKAAYDAVVASAKAGKCTAEDFKARSVAVDSWDCDDPITIVFPWDGFLSQWWGVVYDAADEFAKRPRTRAAAWKSREIGDLLSCSWASFGVGNHYYIGSGSFASGPEGCQ